MLQRSVTTTRMIVVGVLAALLASSGCKKDKPAPKQDDHNAAAPMSDDLRGVLAMMPRDSEMVAAADFAALRGTAVYKAHAGQLKGLAASQLEIVSKLCGFDPTDEIGQVVFAGKGKTKNGDMTALVRGLAKAKVMDCLTKAAAAPPEGFIIAVDGDYAMVETKPPVSDAQADAGVAAQPDPKDAKRRPAPKPPEPKDAGVAAGDAGAAVDDAGAKQPKRGQSVSLKYLDDTTLVVARRNGLALTGAELSAIASGKAADTIVGSKEFMALIDGTDTDAPVWFVVSGKAPLLKAVSRYIAFDAAFGSVRAGDDLDVDLTARMVNDQSAKDFSNLLIRTFDNLKKSTLRDAVGPSSVTVTDRDVRVTLHESGPQLAMLVSKGQELMMALLGAVLGQ